MVDGESADADFRVELVQMGETGWVFPAADSTALREKLALALQTLAEPPARARILAAVAARIAGYTYAQTSAGLLSALSTLPARSART